MQARLGGSSLLLGFVKAGTVSGDAVSWVTEKAREETCRSGVGTTVRVETCEPHDIQKHVCTLCGKQETAVTAVREGDACIVSVFGAPKGSAVIFAAYRDGQMISVRTETYEGENMRFPLPAGWDTAKAMLTDAGYQPLCAAAVLAAADPGLTGADLADRLKASVRQTDELKDKVVSGGVLDLDAAGNIPPRPGARTRLAPL